MDERASHRLSHAERLSLEGRHEEAMAILRPLFAQQPDHIEARVLLARIHAGAGAVRLALEVLDDVLARAPGEAGAARLRDLLQRSDAERGLAPVDPFDRPAVARRLEEAGRLRAALGVWERLCGVRPEAEAEAERIRRALALALRAPGR